MAGLKKLPDDSGADISRCACYENYHLEVLLSGLKVNLRVNSKARDFGSHMRIQELAEKSGLTAHTIRFYEKEGLLDSRHVRRDGNNYRNYTKEAIERLGLIKKFQSIGCSIAELKQVLHDKDAHAPTNREVMAWIRHKIAEVEGKKKEYDQVLATLHRMLEYRTRLGRNPQQGRR